VLQSALCPCTEQHPIPPVSSSKSKSQVQATSTEKNKPPSLSPLSVTVPGLTEFASVQYTLLPSPPACIACVVRSLCSQENRCCNYASNSTALHPLRPLRRSRTTELDRIERRKRGKKKTLKRCIATRSVCHRVREGNAKSRQP
jgi:hypothetical protein